MREKEREREGERDRESSICKYKKDRKMLLYAREAVDRRKK